MSLNSTLATLICNLKVAAKHHKSTNRCRYSKLNIAVVSKLVTNGILKSFKTNEIRKGIKEIEFEMTTVGGEILLNDIKMVSKPGQKIYTSYNYSHIRKHMRFFNCALISTTRGILDHNQCIKEKLGGELLLIYR